MLIQFIINGLTNGSIYALIAIGISMVFKSLGMLNMAHGDTLMISAYASLFMYQLGLPLWLVAILTILIMIAFGFLLERVIYRRLNHSTFVSLLIATIGVSIVLRNSATLVNNAQPQAFPAIFSTESINILGVRIAPMTIGIIGVALVLVLLLTIMFNWTSTGKLMRASASDPVGAAMMGINVDKMRLLTFGISAGVAAVAAFLIAPTYMVRPTMAAMAVNKGFAAAIIGGLGNFYGAVIGGIILGTVEALTTAYISSSYRDVIAFGLLFITLAILPNGILGKRIEQKL